MIERYVHNNICWLDVVSPTSEEIRQIIDECSVPLEYANDLTAMTPKTEVFSRKGFLKITLDFPIVKRTDIKYPHEVKFLVTKTHLVTIRFEEIESLHRFAKNYEVLCMLHGKDKATSPQLFLTMLSHFYDTLYEKLDYLETKLKDIEEEIFNEHEEKMVYELSSVSRRMITFKQTINAHKEALLKLETAMQTAFTKHYTQNCDGIVHQYKIVERHIQALMSACADLRETNNSLLETKQNRIMKFLTVISFITFPLMLVSSVFGMNTKGTPIVGATGDFWFIVLFMATVSILLLIYFKVKRWI